MTFQFPVASKKLKHSVYLINVDNSKIIDAKEIFAINGYEFADRILEDVFFYASISEDRKTIEVFTSSNNDYLEDLNAKKWVKEALESILKAINQSFTSLILKSSPNTYIELLSEDHAKNAYPDLFKVKTQKK